MPSRTAASPHPRSPFLPSSCHREERSDVATCCSRAITPSPAAPTTPLPSAAGLSTHQSPAKRPSLSQSTSGQSQPHPPPAHRSQMRPRNRSHRQRTCRQPWACRTSMSSHGCSVSSSPNRTSSQFRHPHVTDSCSPARYSAHVGYSPTGRLRSFESPCRNVFVVHFAM